MYKIFITLIITTLFCSGIKAQQETISLTLDEVIAIASEKSLDAFRNKNMYRASYWEYRYYKADKLPSLNLDATPLNFNRYRYKDYNFQTGEEEFVLQESLGSVAYLSLDQNIALTGGRVFINTGIERIQNLSGSEKTMFKSTPINIGYEQTLNGYNAMKWQSKIEPLKFENAKKELIKSNEELAIIAVSKFFDLAQAQIQLKIAENNLANNDTLYKVGKGRFQIGTVTQDELLNLELNMLNSKQALSRARSRLQRFQSELNSFLTLDKTTIINCVIPDQISNMQVRADEAITKAIENSPKMIHLQQRMLQADEKVAKRKADAGFNTTIYASYGLDQSSASFDDVYKDPDNSQRVRIGLKIPIIDWGKRKGRYQMAKFEREAEIASIEQARIDFEQNIYQDVIDFNLQAEQVKNSTLADKVAQMRFDVSMQRFLIGKVDVMKMNQARNDRENAKIAYINAIRQYWNYYYSLRTSTLYDFIERKNLAAEYDKLLQN